MKLRNHQFSIQPQIFEKYKHPWYEYNERLEIKDAKLIRPNPPTKEAVERARFIDKTYDWRGGAGSIRSGDERTSQ